MERITVKRPVSAGIILSYKCTSKCKHCMYACSPAWSSDWFSMEGLRLALSQLALSIRPSPYGPRHVSLNHGLHFTGGEPFLNFDLLVKAVKLTKELKIPSVFVETNCFWCVDDYEVRRKLMSLKEAGLDGILISVNPFILEYVPFERTERGIRISREIFGENMMIYQELYYHQFKGLDIKGTFPLDQYLEMRGLALSHAELLPMGRACYALEGLFKKHPVEAFFGESCLHELTRNWHVHIDNYFNYMTGYCGGISLGDIRNADMFDVGLDVSDKPILRALLTDIEELYKLAVSEFGYSGRKGGYVSKCHLCMDIRKHIIEQMDEFKELRPKELYYRL